MSLKISELFKKYDTPVPRYTSYPTVPYWEKSPTLGQWTESLNSALDESDSAWSMYIHIPYCESLCTFCGCNNSITRNHKKEDPYVELLLKEWEQYTQSVPGLLKRPLKNIHLGGGTPTFLSPENLKKLLSPIIDQANIIPEEFEGSIEVHPNKTERAHLEVLRELGFQRVSLGVQDFDPEVQRIVNRNQPYEVTKSLTEWARELGYESVNFDLIYGLPKQELASFEKTIEQTIELRPDRIALYSFAKVPWIRPAQRLFKDSDLPEGAQKRALYEMSREKLIAAGYFEIGMDHFALKTDLLYQSYLDKNLHRNFMGYTDQYSNVLLGLGVSAISETSSCFHQNEKVLPVYERRVNEGGIPSLRGHLLTSEDQVQRKRILQFMTQFELDIVDLKEREDIVKYLDPMIKDGLLVQEGPTIKVTSLGRPFLRNACVALDYRLRRQKPDKKIFSQSL